MENYTINNQNKEKQPQKELEAFHAIIDGLKKQEKEKGGPFHFKDCDPTKLEEVEMKLYEKYESRKLSFSDLKQYRNMLENGGNKSQWDFYAYLGNMIMAEELKRYQEKRPNKIN
jgi:hypothetical protein